MPPTSPSPMRPMIVDEAADAAFHAAARQLGLDPDDYWVGRYVEYEWDIGRLYIDAANLRGNFTNDPTATDAALNTAIVAEIRGNLLNVDGVRTFTTRRLTVDVLKKLQTSAAYAVLKEGRDALAMAIPTMTGDTRAQSEDLLARIDKAIQPYFNN